MFSSITNTQLLCKGNYNKTDMKSKIRDIIIHQLYIE